MKLVNSQNLLIASLLGLLTFLDVFCTSVKAQLGTKPGCQATVDKILQEIRAKGANKVSFRVLKGTANRFNTGNPTNRTDGLLIILDSFYNRQDPLLIQRKFDLIGKILNSGTLLNNWSDNIVSTCNNTAIVSFGPAGSDNVSNFYIQSDGTTKMGECANQDSRSPETPPYLWGLRYCH
jgi:hypothetical protein